MTETTSPRRATLPSIVLGVPIDPLTMDTCVERIAEFVADGRATDRTHQVATVNTDFLMNADDEADLHDLLQATSLNLADGMPLVWLSSRIGVALPERVAGADLVPRLAAESAARGWSIHFFGGQRSVIDRAEHLLLERHPGARLTFDAGPVLSDPTVVDGSVIDNINEINPDILCVALGNPKQERFIAAHADRLRCPVAIGTGGSLDMLVGERKRAPRWAQRVGAEWIFRAAQEPFRLGPRYARDIRVLLPRLLAYVRTVRRFRDGADIVAVRDGELCQVRAVASTNGSLESIEDVLGQMVTARGLEIEFDGVSSLNPMAHAALIAFVRSARRAAIPIEVGPITTSLQRCFGAYRTESLCVTREAGEQKSAKHEAKPRYGCPRD